MRIERRKHVRRGFTLLEVLLVLAILGVLAAFAVPQLLGTQQKANVDATRVLIRDFENHLQRYAVDHDGVYPSGDSETVVEMLMVPGTDKTGRELPAYLSKVPDDAWGNPLSYEYPPSGNRQGLIDKPAIWSVGYDQQDGTQDDIINWNQDL